MLGRRATLCTLVLQLIAIAALCVRAQEEAAESNKSDAPTTGTKQSEQTRADEETVEIPLNQIWAWDMPGTLNIMELISKDPATKQANWLRVEGIRHSLRPLKSGEESGSGYVVEGVGLEALLRAHSVRTGKERAKDSVNAGDDISIVFFAHALNPYVHLSEVKLNNHAIKIEYEIIPTIDAGLSVHFALIPIQDIKPGEYEVAVARAKSDKRWAEDVYSGLSQDTINRVVCKPFRFTAVRPKEE